MEKTQETVEPAGFYLHHPDNPYGMVLAAQNKAVLSIFLEATENLDLMTDNLDLIVKKLVACCGHFSTTRMRYIVQCCVLLHNYLPQFKEHALNWGLLDVNLMRTIWTTLLGAPCLRAPSSLWEKLDDFLVGIFTPTQPKQALPTWPYVQRALRDELIRQGCYEDLELQPEPEPETQQAEPDVEEDKEVSRVPMTATGQPQPAEGYFGVRFVPTVHPGATTMEVTMASDTAYIVEDHLKKTAKDLDMPRVEVVVAALSGQDLGVAPHTTVIFGVGDLPKDTEATMSYAQGVGQLTTTQSVRLSKNAAYVDALEVAKICRTAHDPTPKQRFLTRLRDGMCCFPGCTVDATRCDIDHVINHAAGGWTTLSNLQCLCRTHHNLKTDRHVHATSTAEGIITWEFRDGTTVKTIPRGPLGGIIRGLEEGITTRHSEVTETPEHQTRPPSRKGLGRWGTTFYRKRKRQYERHLKYHGAPPSAGDKFYDWLPVDTSKVE